MVKAEIRNAMCSPRSLFVPGQKTSNPTLSLFRRQQLLARRSSAAEVNRNANSPSMRGPNYSKISAKWD